MPLPKRKYHKRGELVDGYPVRQHPLYATWSGMMNRCYTESSKAYRNYGARGIVVDEAWWHFKQFAADMGTKLSPQHTLERRDNSRGYGPDNCIWATRTEQCLNRRAFGNNTSGVTGVVKNGEVWHARFDYAGTRYSLGYYKSHAAATFRRKEFVALFRCDQSAAIATIPVGGARTNSSTGIRGITPHADGGYTVRVTVDRERKYLGYFKSLEDAIDARYKFLAR